MRELTIKMEPGLAEALEKMANAKRQSVDREVDEVLRRAVRDFERRLDRLKAVDAVAAMTPPGAEQHDSTEMLREDRAR